MRNSLELHETFRRSYVTSIRGRNILSSLEIFLFLRNRFVVLLISSMTESITWLDARETNKSPSGGFRKMKYRQCRKAFSDLNFLPFFSFSLPLFVLSPFSFRFRTDVFSRLHFSSFKRIPRFQFIRYIQVFSCFVTSL